jgi:hypothetical protein
MSWQASRFDAGHPAEAGVVGGGINRSLVRSSSEALVSDDKRDRPLKLRIPIITVQERLMSTLQAVIFGMLLSWTPSIVLLLRELILSAMSVEAIARLLNRTPLAVRKRASKLRLPLRAMERRPY